MQTVKGQILINFHSTIHPEKEGRFGLNSTVKNVKFLLYPTHSEYKSDLQKEKPYIRLNIHYLDTATSDSFH